MAIITLTTDWNNSDYYIASVKARISAIYPKANIIDISHSIPPFNSAQAAFVIKYSYNHFPVGTVHIVGVNTIPEKGQLFLAIKAQGQYFIGTDNGIFALIFREGIERIISIDTKKLEKINISSSGRQNSGKLFPELEIFSEAAAFLAGGGDILELGTEQDSFYRQTPIRAAFEDSRINGSIIYIDSYRNAISNISRELFSRVGLERRFEIFVQSNNYKYKITRINQTYNETSVGELLALFNSIDLLEIAINKGNVSELLGLDMNSSIRIKFHESGD